MFIEPCTFQNHSILNSLVQKIKYNINVIPQKIEYLIAKINSDSPTFFNLEF